MNDPIPPTGNIRYRDEIKNRLAQQGNLRAQRLLLVIVALLVALSICWHYIR